MFSSLAISYQLLAICMKVCGASTQDVSPLLSAAGGNRTILREQIAPGLISNADHRGTFDIVWSCVLTLTACIYTALHMNIPSSTGRKILWAAIALLAPELVLYTALPQFTEARSLVKKLNKQRFGEKPLKRDPETLGTPENTKPTLPFDLRYGFYVTMGGFTMDVEKLHDRVSQVTLTSSGVTALAERGWFLDIKPETISDKSKANVITKILICIQVLWMVVQCIARKAVGYPLTLLEIHTMVHVFCALTLYMLWWKKPLDINEPTIHDLSNDADVEHLRIIALMLMTNISPTGEINLRGELDELNIRKQPTEEPSAELATGSGISWVDGHVETAKDTQRWALAYQEINKDKSMQEKFINQTKTSPFLLFPNALTIKSPIFSFTNEVDSFFEDSRNSEEILGFLSMVLFPVVYGGIHLAAWGFEFPSRTESILWKICCLIIMGTILVFLLIGFIMGWPEAAFVILSFAFFILYTAARIFIVLESFLSLRHVPIGVYAAVPWVQNIPHI